MAKEVILEKVFKVLKEKQFKLITAESITAGKIASDFVTIPGASAVLWGGIICYDTEVKQRVLQVPKETISQYGVISKETATAMAKGALTIFNQSTSKNAENTEHACIALAITGVAGPDLQEDKPAGTVHLALAIQENTKSQNRQPPLEKAQRVAITKTKELHLSGSRDEIRSKCVNEAMQFILESIILN